MTRKMTRPAEQEPLLTVKQVAALDGCSEKTVRRAITEGLLDVVRIEPAAPRAYRQSHRE